MSRWKNISHIGWRKCWRLSDKPTCWIVPPIDQWTLPAGVDYNDHRDEFEDASGNRVDPDYKTVAVLTEAPYLPARGASALAVDMFGATSTDRTYTVNFYYSAPLETALRDCWGIELRNALYRVQSLDIKLLLAEPNEMDVTLVEAEGAVSASAVASSTMVLPLGVPIARPRPTLKKREYSDEYAVDFD